ncbi:MAG TPA: diacylglycerol kinase family protein [Chitinophagaceae bacterium]|nr:diacylglycerol kinase family protein [Chitinophagaceae bacterium]
MPFFKSLGYALQGLQSCFYSEKNFRIQLSIASITFFTGVVCGITRNEWLAVLFCTALVLGLEIINTAIEKLSNVFTTSVHPLIKQVKDIAASAVLLASVISLVTGCIIFIPRIILIIKNYYK